MTSNLKSLIPFTRVSEKTNKLSDPRVKEKSKPQGTTEESKTYKNSQNLHLNRKVFSVKITLQQGLLDTRIVFIFQTGKRMYFTLEVSFNILQKNPLFPVSSSSSIISSSIIFFLIS